MPIYEYQCQACGKRNEAIQKLNDPPLTVCPDCGGALKKMVSSPAFQFKGTGWYATDYAGKKSGGPEGDQGAKKGGDEGLSSDKSSESKPTESASTSEKKESAKPAESS